MERNFFGHIKLNIFELLSNDERVIVFSCKNNNQVYTWNKSCTLQCWDISPGGKFEEVAIRTLNTKPLSFEAARKAAKEWYSIP